jgi:UDP-perosamine 4-acetyltransferase
VRVVILGAGENGYQAFACLRHNKQVEIVGFLDDNEKKHGESLLGVKIIGGTANLAELVQQHRIEGAIAAIGPNKPRKMLNGRLRAVGLKIVQAIHPHVMLESPAHIGDGVILEMGAAVHTSATVGEGVFMGSATMVAHHSTIGEYTMISGGVAMGGGVTVGAFTLLGVGCNIRPHVHIGSNVIVGVGAAVVKDIPDNVVVAGVPAKVVKELDPNSST